MMSPAPGDDHLYVIGESTDSAIVKIGRSNNPAKRLTGVQTGSPQKLHVLHVEERAGPLEEDVHKVLAAQRLNGEWFDFGAKPAVDTVRQVVTDLRTVQEIASRNAVVANLTTTYRRPSPAAPFPAQAPDPKRVREPRWKDLMADKDLCEGPALMAVIDAAVHYLFASHPHPAGYLLGEGIPAHYLALYYGVEPRFARDGDAELLDHAACERQPSIVS